MIIAIIVLAIISLLGIGAVIFLLRVLNECADIILEECAPKNFYRADVIAIVYFNADYDGMAADFSRYEDKGIIGMSAYYTRAPLNEHEEKINGIPIIAPDALVYEAMKGVYAWQPL